MSIPGIRWMFPRTGIVGGPADSLAYLYHMTELAAAPEVSLLKLVKLSWWSAGCDVDLQLQGIATLGFSK